MSSEQAYWNEMYAAACEQRRPFVQLRPRIFLDGNQWCALYGDNLQDGVAGFGDSPELAAWNFDKNWCAKVAKDDFAALKSLALRAVSAARPICATCHGLGYVSVRQSGTHAPVDAPVERWTCNHDGTISQSESAADSDLQSVPSLNLSERQAVRHACYRLGGLIEARDPEGALTKALLSIRNELEDAFNAPAASEQRKNICTLHGEKGWCECWQCGGMGKYGHECGEDCCVCLEPEDNERCDICNGNGGWLRCYECMPETEDELQ